MIRVDTPAVGDTEQDTLHHLVLTRLVGYPHLNIRLRELTPIVIILIGIVHVGVRCRSQFPLQLLC